MPSGAGNHLPILASTEAGWLSESPYAIRLLGPVWTGSGLTLQAPCKLYAGDHWAAGTVVATGATFATIRTAAGTSRCSDRRNILNEEEAVLFKRQTAAFRRLLKKRQEQGGRTNG